MASSSLSARRTRGIDTPEYKIVRGYLGPLVKQCQHVLVHFATELFSKELIAKLEYTNAIDEAKPMYHRTASMMDSVLTKIENNSSCFNKLIVCLRVADQNDIANDLEDDLREDRGHCPAVVAPSSTRAADIQPSISANNTVATSDELIDDSLKPAGDKFAPPVTESGSKLVAQGSVLIPSGGEDFDPAAEDDPVAEDVPEPVTFSVEPHSNQGVLQPIPEEDNSEHNTPPRPSPSTGSDASVSSKHRFPSRTLPHCMSVDRQLSNRSLRQLNPGWNTKIYLSSSVVGDPVDVCVKPMLPLKRNPLVDALSTPILTPLKLVKVQKVQDGYSPFAGDTENLTAQEDEPPSLPKAPITQEDEPPSLPKAPITQEDEPPSVPKAPITQEDKPPSLPKAPIAQEDEPPSVPKAPIAQEDEPPSVPKAPITQEDEPPSLPKAPITREEAPMAQEQVSVSKRKHPMVKNDSFCICHIQIEFLQTKLSNRMKEIDILKGQVDQLVIHFEEERERKTAAIKEQAQLKAQRDKEVGILEEELAFKNKLILQLKKQEKDYESKIDKLSKECESREAQKHIAESVAKETVSRCGELHERLIESEATAEHYKCSYERKCKSCEALRQKIYALEKEHESEIEQLKSELAKAKQREVKLKKQMVRTGYETVKSEMVAQIEECIYETNTNTWSTLAPLLQRRVEREMRKATQNLDAPGMKIAEELIRKTNSMILAISEAPPARSRSMSNGERGDIRALDLVTPDKDTELSWL